MSVENIQSLQLGSLHDVGGADAVSPGGIQGPSGGPGASSFADTLGQALAKVDGFQVEADREADQVALGGGNLHEMALAMEKADVAMRLAMKVRGKLVDAYQDIMKMTV